MKKNLKLTRRKGVFFFFNKKKIFHHLLKNIVSSYNDHYRVIPEDSSCSNVSGDIHFRLEERPSRVHSIRIVDLFYRASSKEIKLTFCKSALPKGLSRQNCTTNVQTLCGMKISPSEIKTRIVNWFQNEKVRGFKVNVTFCTEFPLFNYNRTFITETIGSTMASNIVEGIFREEVSKISQLEISRFQEMFKTARQMCDSTLHCSVISLEKDKGIGDASKMMEVEIGHGIHKKMFPLKQPEKPRNWLKEYIKNVYLMFVWLRKNSIPGRVQ